MDLFTFLGLITFRKPIVSLLLGIAGSLAVFLTSQSTLSIVLFTCSIVAGLANAAMGAYKSDKVAGFLVALYGATVAIALSAVGQNQSAMESQERTVWEQCVKDGICSPVKR